VLDAIWSKPLQSLASRVTFLAFAATLVTSLVITLVSTQSLHSFLREKIDEKFPAVLSGVAERLDIWYGQRKLDLATFARSPIVASNYAKLKPGSNTRTARRARGEVGDYLAYVLERFPQYEMLVILDAKGRQIFASGKEIELTSTLRERLAGVVGSAVSDIHVISGQRVQVASAAIEDNRARSVGSLHGILRLRSADDLLHSETLGPGGVIYLVGRDGTYLTPTVRNEVGAPYVRPLPDPGEAARVEDYSAEGGDRVVGAAVRLERFGWTLVVEEPYREAFQPSVAAMRKVLFINLMTVLLFSLIAFWMALSIVRPVQALSQGARRIAEGETDVVVIETSSHDEIGLLTRTFNRMSARLHRNRIELQESRLSIEAANVRLRGQNEELHRMNEALEQLSITDGLTKLYNHRFFQEHLTRELARVERSGETLCLILADIDNFKQLNDRFGHAAGDQVLCEVARVMSCIVRESDILARYGGEEFALVPSASSLEGAVGLAEKIRLAISETDMVLEEAGKPVVVRVTVSIGVAALRRDRKTFFNDADRALYRAKAAGKDCVVVETGDDEAGAVPEPAPKSKPARRKPRAKKKR
jgi:diguanylate cyclase (GGDEF)-like protein